MKKFMVFVTTAVVTILFSVGVASAGEYNGNGDAVPGGVNGKSECSFSGLDIADDLENDGFDDDALFTRGIQNYGQIVSLVGKDFAPGPGIACRGNLGGGE